jgi:hypothetical protein
LVKLGNVSTTNNIIDWLKDVDEAQTTKYVKWQGDQDSGHTLLELKSAAGCAREYYNRFFR